MSHYRMFLTHEKRFLLVTVLDMGIDAAIWNHVDFRLLFSKDGSSYYRLDL
jgi:hypothetical protein